MGSFISYKKLHVRIYQPHLKSSIYEPFQLYVDFITARNDGFIIFIKTSNLYFFALNTMTTMAIAAMTVIDGPPIRKRRVVNGDKLVVKPRIVNRLPTIKAIMSTGK